MSSQLRGEDISPLLVAEAPQTWNRSKTLMWEWRLKVAGPCWNGPPSLAARKGRYKLLQEPDGNRVELYDMEDTGAYFSLYDERVVTSQSGLFLRRLPRLTHSLTHSMLIPNINRCLRVSGIGKHCQPVPRRSGGAAKRIDGLEGVWIWESRVLIVNQYNCTILYFVTDTCSTSALS